MRPDRRRTEWREAWVAAVAVIGIANCHVVTADTDPVAEHYDASRAALERMDLVAAEREAAAAYELSGARRGDDGITCALALHLANVRLAQGRPEAALEPAGRAWQRVEALGAASGLDPSAARLAFARASLPGGGEEAVQRLELAIAEEAAQPGSAAYVYAAAVDLAQFAASTQRNQIARDAWATAARILAGDPNPNPVSLATAWIGQAAADILLQLQRDRLLVTPTSSRLRDGDVYRPAHELLTRAAALLADAARERGPTSEPTPAQTLYAQAQAWRTFVALELRTEGLPTSLSVHAGFDGLDIGGADDRRPPCAIRILKQPRPVLGSSGLVHDDIAVAIIKARFDDSGAVEHAVVAAAVGGTEFVEAVDAVAGRWRIGHADPSNQTCRLARETFLKLTYSD